MSFEMFLEVFQSVLTTLGGATVIVFAFAHFLGKNWTDRITKQTQAKYEQELAVLKSKHTMALEDFKRKADFDLKDFEYFGGISKEVYQNFFKNRVETYIALLEIKNTFISTIHEDAAVDEFEAWGEAYFSIYSSFKKTITRNQLYISNELEKTFHALRIKASEYVKEADLIELRGSGLDAHPLRVQEQMTPAYEKLGENTYKEMLDLINQIDSDVSKLRSRIDLDRSNTIRE